MIPNQDIDMLTEAMRARCDGRPPLQQTLSGPDPFILFLGNECAHAAKVPDIEDIAERALDLFGGDSVEGARYLPNVDRSDKDGVLKALYKVLDQVSGGLVYSMLQSLYLNIPVPLFYQDLALLVKAGYFNRIITTNFDTLLEQALNGAGMQAGFDYFVTSLGIKSDDREDAPPVQQTNGMPSDDSAGEGREPVRIIKLHGDLAQQQINLSPTRIEKALRSQGRFVKRGLKGDMVMVGYKFETDKINDWLASTGTTREQLWWVSQEPPDRYINDWAAQVSFVGGEIGRPEAFFSQLVLRLLRQPVLKSLNKSFKDYIADYGLSIEEETDEAKEEGGEDETYGEKDLAVLELRDRIRHSQSVLFSHEQSSDAALRSPSVQTQIDYQKRQIARFEDKLRENPECRKRIIELVNLIASYAEGVSDRLKPKTLDFLQGQVTVVLHEYEQEQHPNQQIISASLCTIVLLGDRLRVELGGEAITLESLRELASYVPSLAARGVVQ